MPAGKIYKATHKMPSNRQTVSPATKKYVKRTINSKLRTLDKVSFGSAVDLSYDSPTLIDLTAISQDVSEDGRRGEDIELKSIKFKGYVVRGSADSYARVCIVQWRPDTTADTLTLSDMFYQGSSVLNAYWQAPRADSKSDGEFKVLYDIRIPLLSANNKTVQMLSKNIFKGFRKHINFHDNATTGQNHIFLVAFSNVTNASGSEPDFFYDVTVTYKN